MASRSHKDRVAEYNDKLEKIPEHYDIPLVSFTWAGRDRRANVVSVTGKSGLDNHRSSVFRFFFVYQFNVYYILRQSSFFVSGLFRGHSAGTKLFGRERMGGAIRPESVALNHFQTGPLRTRNRPNQHSQSSTPHIPHQKSIPPSHTLTQPTTPRSVFKQVQPSSPSSDYPSSPPNPPTLHQSTLHSRWASRSVKGRGGGGGRGCLFLVSERMKESERDGETTLEYARNEEGEQRTHQSIPRSVRRDQSVSIRIVSSSCPVPRGIPCYPKPRATERSSRLGYDRVLFSGCGRGLGVRPNACDRNLVSQRLTEQRRSETHTAGCLASTI
jgi:hypothetical protein